jgi:hypothetical protein
MLSNEETAELESKKLQKADDWWLEYEYYEIRQRKTKWNRTLIDKDVPNHQS